MRLPALVRQQEVARDPRPLFGRKAEPSLKIALALRLPLYLHIQGDAIGGASEQGSKRRLDLTAPDGQVTVRAIAQGSRGAIEPDLVAGFWALVHVAPLVAWLPS